MTDTISNRSMYLINTTANKEIDGVMYEAKVKKVVYINFSKTNYTAKVKMYARNDIEVEFIPESMDFLHELMDIFPLSEYDYKIIRPAKRIKENKSSISIEIQVIEKTTGIHKWLGDNSIILSDKDYDHFRNILLQAFPDHEWRSIDEEIKFKIAEYMEDYNFGLADAADTLVELVAMRYKEVKDTGFVHFRGDNVYAIAMNIMVKAITEYGEKEKAKEGEKTNMGDRALSPDSLSMQLKIAEENAASTEECSASVSSITSIAESIEDASKELHEIADGLNSDIGKFSY